MRKERIGVNADGYISDRLSYRAKVRARRRMRHQRRRRLLAVVVAAVVLALAVSAIVRAVRRQGESKTAADVPAATQTSAVGGFYDNAAFIGNSFVADLELMGLVKEADFYGKVGLNVDSAMSEPIGENGASAVEELCMKDYNRVFMVFGENELGWREPEVFISKYRALIQKVKAEMPGVQIYVQSVTPVTLKAEQETTEGVTNANIRDINALIQRVAAEEQVQYADVYSAMVNDQGYLPDDVGGDGIHFDKKHCEIWVNYLRDTCD